MPRGRSGGLRRSAARAVYEAGTIAGRYPWVALAVARRRGHGEPVGERTEVVIEGYPRSANTFAVAALACAQPVPVHIAHHVHVPANVIAGVRRRLPTLVLVNEPEEAVVAFALGKPALSVGQALRGWVRFYRPLLRYRGRIVFVTTSEACSDFGSVIRRMNAHFGVSFHEFDGTEEGMAEARRRMDRYVAGREGPGLPFVGRSGGQAGPVEDAGSARDGTERLRREYGAPRLAAIRQEAARLHRTLIRIAR